MFTPSQIRVPFRLRLLGVVVLLSMTPALADGQTPAGEAPWFGVPLPPVFEPHVAPAIIGDRGPAPAVVVVAAVLWAREATSCAI